MLGKVRLVYLTAGEGWVCGVRCRDTKDPHKSSELRLTMGHHIAASHPKSCHMLDIGMSLWACSAAGIQAHHLGQAQRV